MAPSEAAIRIPLVMRDPQIFRSALTGLRAPGNPLLGKLHASSSQKSRSSCMRCLLLILAVLGYAASARAQALRIGMRDDPDILDPTLSRTYVGTLVMTAICDKLFDFDTKLGDRAGAGDRLRVGRHHIC